MIQVGGEALEFLVLVERLVLRLEKPDFVAGLDR